MRKFIMVGLVSIFVFALVTPSSAEGIKDKLPDIKKRSGVVPGMGEHWGGSKKYPGATFGQYKGKIIFIEYEANNSEMVGDKNVFWENFVMPPFMGEINHTDIEYLPKGHRGMTFPHVAVHMYTISHAEHKAIKPPKK